MSQPLFHPCAASTSAISVTRGVGKMQERLRVASSPSLLIAAWVLITRSSKSLKAGDLTRNSSRHTGGSCWLAASSIMLRCAMAACSPRWPL